MSLVPGEDAADVRRAIDRVIARGWFVLGPEVGAFEQEFAAASPSEPTGRPLYFAPCAWHASSITAMLWRAAISRIGSMSAGWP